MDTELFTAEPIIGCDRNHWQVIEQTCGLDIVRCETFNREWALLIALLLNESKARNHESVGQSGESTAEAARKGR